MEQPDHEGDEQDFLEFDSSSDEDHEKPENVSKKKMYPWVKSSSKINNSALRFHVEIMEFYRYISPTEADINKRRAIFEHISRTIKVRAPDPESNPQSQHSDIDCYLFGSLSSGLYLPNSDIDLVVYKHKTKVRSLMDQVVEVFKDSSHGIQIEEVLHKAKVPIVKCVHVESGINVDIIFNELSGLLQIDQFEQAIRNYPEFKFLYLLLKFFLRQRRLNETYTGGVGKRRWQRGFARSNRQAAFCCFR